mmetsp:Transcript_23397/g.3838  ORF Transcript_23397/g.3838 Transcript_23397/m.3838 type:complete len:128 (+) Transcript_23397:145-528(+)
MPWATEPLNFNLYSGYLNLTNTNGIKIHYVFAESQSNPSTDPVVLWLNGGPGCSSMDGFLYENGPYYFAEQSTYLQKNQYAWNTQANMLYLEAPAGVGFSLYGNATNLNANDNSTAVYNAQALGVFF